MNHFTDLKLTRNNLDNYFIRSTILKAVELGCLSFKGEFLDVGCGKMPYRKLIKENSDIDKYVGLDIAEAIEYDAEVKADYTWDGVTMPFEDNSFESSMATEVLEHCPNPVIILNEINRVLKPGSTFLFTVPFIWNLHETPYDEYRYTPFALKRLLQEAGFKEIEVKASGGWHASMAQMMGLWLIRSNMPLNLRRILKIFLYPFYKLLIKYDKGPDSFSEGAMSPSFVGFAKAGI